jgi:hypothetical protein
MGNRWDGFHLPLLRVGILSRTIGITPCRVTELEPMVSMPYMTHLLPNVCGISATLFPSPATKTPRTAMRKSSVASVDGMARGMGFLKPESRIGRQLLR